MKALILAGGRGTRLWPVSREKLPKQFRSIVGDKTLLEETVERIAGFDFFVSTTQEFKLLVRDLLHLDEERIIVEPKPRNTAPAIAFAFKYLVERGFVEPEEAIAVLPSDHYITPKEGFPEYLEKAEKLAGRYLVTFGVKPRSPETGYGYILPGEKINEDAFHVRKFVEKPDREYAEQLINENALWNSGIFVFTPKLFFQELEKCSPEMYSMLGENLETARKNFKKMPNLPVDIAVLEKSNRVACIPLSLFWSDLGSWDVVYEVEEKDGAGNCVKGNVLTLETHNSLIYSEDEKLLCTVGVKDLIVVDTGDVTLVLNRGWGQLVRRAVEELKALKRKEVTEHIIGYRPWGFYRVLGQGRRYKIKLIVVYPGAKLSLQRHFHRSEHWIVVRGTAIARIDDTEHVVREGESIFVPKATLHRLENPGKINLEIVEVQIGEYLEEDDIERLDAYGREREE